MSRVPRTTKSSTSLRGQYRAPATSPSKSTPPLPANLKHRPPTSTPSRATSSKVPTQNVDKVVDGRTSPATKERMSLKEQIALKRAEVKKAQTQANVGNDEGAFGPGLSLLGTPVKAKKEEEDVVEMGRWSVRETVERARSTGILNISARSLVCIPSCLFELHLGVTPIPLPSVTEPDYPEDVDPRKLKPGRQQPSWFEAQDLVVLKARSNEIVELQPELSLFGSLKTIDLHSNMLRSLPESLTILSMLTVLDVSNNKLTELPPSIFSLSSLTVLDISHNEITSLPFSKFNEPLKASKSIATGGFFEPEVKRAEVPLPKLHNLNASHNKLTAHAIDHDYLPSTMRHVTLAHNPLGKSSDLLSHLSMLNDLQVLSLNGADLDDVSLKHLNTGGFPTLNNLDLGETRVTEQAVRNFFSGTRRESKLNFNISTAPPIPGELRVVVGKQVIKEQWEIEAEQRYLKKKRSMVGISSESKDSKSQREHTAPVADKEPWEVEAEQGLLTEGGRRRARLNSTIANAASSTSGSKQTITRPKVVEKEAWEIEAEQGLLTEGGRRRLRAQQAAATSPASHEKGTGSSTSTSSVSSLANSTYYSSKELSLTLPPSAPPSRGHARAFSLVAASQSQSKPEDMHVPAPTFPLNVIAIQNFASTLRVLTLKNRRADPTFAFPPTSFVTDASSNGGILPRLEELNLEGCSLGDTVLVAHELTDKSSSPISRKQNLLEVISTTFPSLTILDLSYNTVSSDLFNEDTTRKLLLSSDGEPCTRRGLKILRLRGNRLTNLDVFDAIATMFKGNRQVPEWKLEEFDVRDNNISKLPVNLGLLPLDVFLVDGNTFRVPPRKVWEREGTKGLSSWLRSRIE